MIIRAILDHPALAENFDHFNDHRDTLGWLHRQPASDQKIMAIFCLTSAARDKGLDPETGFPLSNRRPKYDE